MLSQGQGLCFDIGPGPGQDQDVLSQGQGLCFDMKQSMSSILLTIVATSASVASRGYKTIA